MSIRLKLLLSYIAMIIVPTIIFILTAILVIILMLKGSMSPVSKFIGDFESMQTMQEMMQEQDEWTSGIAYFSKYETERFNDAAFLRRADEALGGLKAGLAIEKNGTFSFISSSFNKEELVPKLESIVEKLPVFGFRENDELVISGVNYTVLKYPLDFGGGSKGAAYVLTEDRVSDVILTIFPIILLFILLVVGLTNGGLTYLMSRSFIKPLYGLKRAAQQIKEGNLDFELKLGRKDEFGQLSAAFEEMRVRLKDSLGVQLQVEESRKELISNISHDLKTPITAITACAEGMKDGIADSPEMQMKYIEMIHKKATHMNRLIDELFLFSKLDLKRLPFYFEQTDIIGFLDNYVEELRLHPQYSGIRFSFHTGEERPLHVMADREKLGRVISNIVDNSIKHMDGKIKQVEFKLSRNSSGATVSIRDSGRGISADALPHIFDRFYRAESARNTDTGGTGLGLAIVKQIIEGHGGWVWAESRLEEGTAIMFTLLAPEGQGGDRHEKNIDH